MFSEQPTWLMVAGADLLLASNGEQLPHELGATNCVSAYAFTIKNSLCLLGFRFHPYKGGQIPRYTVSFAQTLYLRLRLIATPISDYYRMSRGYS